MAEAAAHAVPLLGARFLALQHQPDVAVDHVVGRALRRDASVEQQDGAVGELLHQAQVVGDEQHRDAALAQLLKLAHAAVGEDRVAYRQGFVHDEDFGVHVNGRREGQAHVHAARILFHRPFDELADLREGLDGGHGAGDFGAAEPHDLAVQVDVFAAGELRVETGAQLQQGGDAPARHHAPGGGLQNAADNLQQGALAAPVGSHQAQGLALFELEPDVAQGPEIGVERAAAGQQLAQPVGRAPVQPVQFGDVLNEDQLRL